MHCRSKHEYKNTPPPLATAGVTAQFAVDRKSNRFDGCNLN